MDAQAHEDDLDGGWPLSAVATELLQHRPVARQRWALLTLKELVLSGVWAVVVVEQPRRLVGVRRTTVLRAGLAAVPDRPPLGVLDAWLRRRVAGEVELREVAEDLRRAAEPAGQGLIAATGALLARSLVAPATTRLLGRPTVRRTPLGDAWVAGLEARRSSWTAALRQGGAAAERAAQDLARSPGLAVLLDGRAVRDVDRAMAAGDDAAWSGLSGVDGLGGLGGLAGAFDSGGFDSGGSDAGSFDSGGSDSGGG